MQYHSIALPLIGSGSGNRGKQWSLNIIKQTLEAMDSDIEVIIVTYSRQ
ncbi:hypothetical protein [Thaumasiovibrio subtropicus]|nr:hypothetical protein [Thaumasiovibrio subtropicus]